MIVGLISKEVDVVLDPKTIKYYENLGYEIPRRKDKWGVNTVPRGTKIIIKVEDLKYNSNVLVYTQCDGCNKELKPTTWQAYNKCVHEDGKYYCYICAMKLYGNENKRATRLKNSYSFEKWCINNNCQDILSRWDYDLNKYKPNEITYSVNKKYYFKCPKGLHKSELKLINRFTAGEKGTMDCNQCNSFAQWGIDNLGEDFLDKYWDYGKNTVNPWEITRGSKKSKVYIICQEDIIHDSYYILPNSFTSAGCRCPNCNNSKGEKRCKEVFLFNKFIEINQDSYNKLLNYNDNIYFIPPNVF